MRGLKLIVRLFLIMARVASFTDAWIETEKQLSRITRKSVASFTDAWIETWNKQKDLP